MISRSISSWSAVFWCAASLLTHVPATQAADVAKGMRDAANHYLASLSEEQTQQTRFDFAAEERLNWHFIPRERLGLPLREMDQAQRQLALNLLHSGMSYDGFTKAVTIMSLEKILWEMENHAPRRDPGGYFISIFGTPDTGKTWGWRVEGHHLSLNFTVVNGKNVAATPSFFGTNPGKVQEGPRKGLQVLASEENQARSLARSLSKEQQAKCIIATEAPKDILTKADRKVEALAQEGIRYADLDAAQKNRLMNLIQTYLKWHRPELQARDWEKIRRAGLDDIRFAWAGSLKVGEGHYYRIQGSTFLLEYDNTQNNANHVHAVYRDFDNDFGIDWLAKHHAETPHKN